MDVTPVHITRISDFIFARIDEQMTGDDASRHFEDDPVSRSLRALRNVTDEIRSRQVLERHTGSPMASAVDLVLTFAWSELATIAKQWKDHPDYLPEFALLAHQLGAEPTAQTP